MEKARRKELISTYKHTFPSMGIFSVTNKITGKQLLGKSKNLNGSLNRHRMELRMGVHRNPELMEDWRSLGEDHFVFEILELIKERPEPGFDYTSELDKCLEQWQGKVPPGSSGSYL